VMELAEKVREAGKEIGLDVAIQHIDNPRKELEEHYYNPTHTGLLELGLEPHFLTVDVLVLMLEFVKRHEERIDEGKIFRRVSW
ncbi:MAG: NAD-dependent dehydratase, partial [Deltaproteobacteria bacterium]|nr:NAD-dependent dehydratase [Deltaproteobacteria bacterium]MBW2008863.1 NAD-dependent dehydratase [Deltaproteobacteria bacterium]